MRTTNMSLGCLENTLVGIGGTEVGHWLGLPVHNAGFSSDAKHAGIQAGYEKALKGFAAASAGADILSGGIGLIDSSNTWYMPLIPIEAEIIAMIERMLGEVEVSQSTLLGEMVERVGIGGNFLGETETRRRVRAGEHFMPWIAARTSYDTWKTAGRTEIDVGRERAEQLLVRHAEREPSLTEDQQRELASICGVVPGRTR
jgi:trimethylamine--corrinoid protein Co-methyltransferase